MDKSTEEFLHRLCKKSPSEARSKIRRIWKKFAEFDRVPITPQVIHHLMTEIDAHFYGKRLLKFLEAKRGIKVKVGTFCRDKNNPQFFAAGRTEQSDNDWDTTDFYVELALDEINQNTDEKVYFSGGYVGDSRVKWIVLGLLHETIHLVEFADDWIRENAADHCLFFYRWGYHVFGMLTQLTEVFEDASKLCFDISARLENIKRIRNLNPLGDGVKILDDHSEIIVEWTRIPRYICYEITV